MKIFWTDEGYEKHMLEFARKVLQDMVKVFEDVAPTKTKTSRHICVKTINRIELTNETRH